MFGGSGVAGDEIFCLLGFRAFEPDLPSSSWNNISGVAIRVWPAKHCVFQTDVVFE
jgi:hypothetical protein